MAKKWTGSVLDYQAELAVRHEPRIQESTRMAARNVASEVVALLGRLPHVVPAIPGLTPELAAELQRWVRDYLASGGTEVSDSRGRLYLSIGG